MTHESNGQPLLSPGDCERRRVARSVLVSALNPSHLRRQEIPSSHGSSGMYHHVHLFIYFIYLFSKVVVKLKKQLFLVLIWLY